MLSLIPFPSHTSYDYAVDYVAILVNCSELKQAVSVAPALQAPIVGINDLCTETESNLLRALVAHSKYRIFVQEFRKDDGFAVLRKTPDNLPELACSEFIGEF